MFRYFLKPGLYLIIWTCILSLAACAPGGGNDDTSDGTPPVVSGLARYLDTNANSISDFGDELIVPFDQDVILNVTDASIFTLPVSGDSFGSGASVIAGPAANEITIILGTSPSLKTRQDYNGTTTINSPSGIDISTSLTLNAIEGASGIDAAASTPIDIIPAFVDTLESIGSEIVPEISAALALGDVDNDGDLDMAVANNGMDGAQNRIYTNDGAGNFTDSGQLLGGYQSSSIALGDVDNDGDLDMAVANGGGHHNSNKVYINNGVGVFSDSGQSLGRTNDSLYVALDSLYVALGDVDNDGDLDMAVANGNGQPNKVYINNGVGVFSDSGQSLGTDDSTSIASGDVDSDGDLDIVVANWNGQPNKVYINNGVGVFSDSGQSLGTNDSRSVALGDVDSDGDLDMVIANLNGQSNKVYINNGVGVFTDSGQSLGSNSSRSVVLGDVDGDSDLDMVVAINYGDIHVYTNDGVGNFTDTGESPNLTNSTYVAFGDVDKDGDLDMAVARTRDLGVKVLLNSLSGTWGSAIYIDTGQQYLISDFSRSVTLGDIDSDGDLDMIDANAGSGNRIYYNNGEGIFMYSGQSLGAYNSMSIDSGDVDNDGDLDMVVANYSGQFNRVYINDGVGVFSDSGQSLGANYSRSVALGDVDNDGDLDLVVGNEGGNRIYYNDAGIFSDSGQSLGTEDSYSVALGDVDSDGDLDMVVANDFGQPSRVYTNNGAGVFSDSGQSLGTDRSFSVALGDVDSDSDLDIVVANNGQPNRVYINDGSGFFTDSTQSLDMFYHSVSVALSDIDGDGDLDMVVANPETFSTIYINDGTGNYTVASDYDIGGYWSMDIAINDVDSDGDQDIVAGKIGPNTIHLNDNVAANPGWPTVVTIDTPSGTWDNVDINTTVNAVFSQEMDEETVNTTTFTLEVDYPYEGPIERAPIEGTVTYSGLTATFTPSSPLAYNTFYSATITTGPLDIAGNPLVYPKSFLFVTETGSASPSVFPLFPSNGQTNAAINTAVKAMFNEYMNGTTINTSTFTLKDEFGTFIPGTVSYLGLYATFTPTTPLAYDTTYTATITTGAQDTEGNPLASDVSWSFTTAIIIDDAPQIAY